MVERGPEKAGVGGSIPSLATFFFGTLRLYAINGGTPTSDRVHEHIILTLKE